MRRLRADLRQIKALIGRCPVACIINLRGRPAVAGKMSKLAVLIWIMAGNVLAGMGVIVVLLTPTLMARPTTFIALAAILGYVVAIPLSIVIAKQVMGQKAA